MTDPTVAYGALSYWHDTAPMRAASRRIEPGAWFDVAILGAGYTGLWTAHHLLERDPSLQVALIEKEEVGFGASGRNGGFAMTKIGHSLHQMTRDHGVEQTLAVHEAAEGAVQGLAATVEREGIDCELRYGGLLTVATNDAQARKLGRELDAVDRLGLKTIRAMGGEEVQASVHSPTYRMALSEEHCAVLHPAKLARGLADSVVRKGVALFERAGSATLVDEGNRVRVDTVSGPIYAKQAVIATNAWTARNPAFSRWLIPMYTYIIATEPLSEATWAEIGWDGSEGIEDKRVHLHYYRRTLDGRILWGGRDNTATFNNAIGTRYDRNEHIFGLLQASFAATFPQLVRRPVHPRVGWPDRPHPRLPPALREHLGARPLRLRLLRSRGRTVVPRGRDPARPGLRRGDGADGVAVRPQARWPLPGRAHPLRRRAAHAQGEPLVRRGRGRRQGPDAASRGSCGSPRSCSAGERSHRRLFLDVISDAGYTKMELCRTSEILWRGSGGSARVTSRGIRAMPSSVVHWPEVTTVGPA